jgi:ABC-type glycerol-3-phosphate transport system substrate-binding protein
MGRSECRHPRRFDASPLVRRALWLAATALGLGMAIPAHAATTLKLVEVITSPERTETLKNIVKTFEDANPDVRVEITSLPWGPSFDARCLACAVRQ